MPDNNNINWTPCDVPGIIQRRMYIKIGDLYILHYMGTKSYYLGNKPKFEGGGIAHLDTVLKDEGAIHEQIFEWKGRDHKSISETELNLMLLKYLY